MIDELISWIGSTLPEYELKKKSCLNLYNDLRGLYSKEFLAECFYVTVDDVPKPYHLKGESKVIDNFLKLSSDGITYSNTYFVKRVYENEIELHCHELVHAVQWKHLGMSGFIKRYIDELTLGLTKYEFEDAYRNAPLEKMAYKIQDSFHDGTQIANIESDVISQLENPKETTCS